MIKDDVLVFGCVAHPFGLDPFNVLGNAGEMFRQHVFTFYNVLTPENEPKLSLDESCRSGGPLRSAAWSSASPTRACSSLCPSETREGLVGAA